MAIGPTIFYYFFRYGFFAVPVAIGLYTILLAALTMPAIQAHVAYLYTIREPWFNNINVPETSGFLRNQVTPFSIDTSDGERLYAWHVLPLEVYRKHEALLVAEPAGYVSDITSRLAFQLLRDDPEARLVIHLHGAGGTLVGGFRLQNYQALSTNGKIHVLAFDYRGFGHSTGTPSESGLILDALAVTDWAIKVAGIPPSRILLLGHSLGTGVSVAVSTHLALESPPVVFAGTVLVAPFVDVATLTLTYKVANMPLLSPLAQFPLLFNTLQGYIKDKWLSKDRLAQYVRANEANGEKYRLTILHSEDDGDIPWSHTPTLFWYAVNASMPGGISRDDLERKKKELRVDLGAGGSATEWQADNGVIREEILKTGFHDLLVGYPVVTMAVIRSFEAMDPSFAS